MLFTDFNLDARLAAGIRKAGYTTPTPIQVSGIPAVIGGRDLIATAQTGTGKTAAFVLPMLHQMLSKPGNGRSTRALILTPTRELALQILETIEILATGTGLRAATVFGGVGANPQIQALRSGTDIIVACPGRLLDLQQQGEVDFSSLGFFVLDEADRMFDMGFLPEVKRIIRFLPAKRQNLLFSATFPKEVEDLAAGLLHNPERVKVGISKPAHTVAHALYPVEPHLKAGLLLELLRKTDANSVLIFTRTKHRAKKLAQKLEREGYKVTSLHGNRSQNQRQEALGGFKDGKYDIMVATDIAARGIDVSTISHVINFDMPDTADAYIHRIGRTGRAERTGDAYTLVSAEDNEMIRILEKIMGSKLDRAYLDGFDYKAPAPPKEEEPARPMHRGRRPASGGGGRDSRQLARRR
ncbi:MAG: DEAD/DEAH box helicase [Bacteroidetes bacterium]|nr:DEAD/DEAH box helicase [Bacteroidota bacterium]